MEHVVVITTPNTKIGNLELDNRVILLKVSVLVIKLTVKKGVSFIEGLYKKNSVSEGDKKLVLFIESDERARLCEDFFFGLFVAIIDS